MDTDSYDFFMLEAILEVGRKLPSFKLCDQGGHRPRVIITEYNANFELTEAKSILPPESGSPWQFWRGTTYHGMSLLATKRLLERFGYSMLWCNKVAKCLDYFIPIRSRGGIYGKYGLSPKEFPGRILRELQRAHLKGTSEDSVHIFPFILLPFLIQTLSGS